MKVLLVAARRPARFGRGDQKRAWFWSRQLAPGHDVTLLCLGLPDDEPDAHDANDAVRLITRHANPRRRLVATARGLVRGIPLQTAWTMGSLRRGELEALAADYDVVIALTVRVVDGELPAPTLLDHVDALSLNMDRRARIDPSRFRRLGARLEGRLLRRHEQRLARWLRGQMVTTADDAAALPPVPAPSIVLPHLELPTDWEEHREAAAPRPVDVILTGNMRYPPNRAAYDVLVDDLLPLLREARPGLTVCVVGRDAGTLRLHQGIEVRADVSDMAAELRRAKVAIAPVDGGTGAPNKVLEAGAAGCAVVAPSWVMRAFSLDLPGADGPRQAAAQILALLADDDARERNAATVMAAARGSEPGPLGVRAEALLLEMLGGPPPVAASD